MSRRDRAAWRNIHFYEASTGDMLGGTFQLDSMTEANFLTILGQILLLVEGPWTVKNRSSGQTIEQPKTSCRQRTRVGRSRHRAIRKCYAE
jgi:hypothetical protein